MKSFCKALVLFLDASLFVSLAIGPLLAQRGGPVAPGPSVAGHWAGKMVMVLVASKREVTIGLDFTLEETGNTVSGALTYITPGSTTPHIVPIKGIEEEGKLNILWDFSDVEHCRLHLAVDNDKLTGNLVNSRDNPRLLGNDGIGEVTLNKIP
jgi:hypothetical protein